MSSAIPEPLSLCGIHIAAFEYRIATLNIGSYIFESELFHERGQGLHRQLVFAADVDTAKQCDVRVHSERLLET
jgi:hypothetical protein